MYTARRVRGVPKKRWPLRRVTEWRQNFQSTQDRPHGWIEERLECGHIYYDDIAATGAEHHQTAPMRRRCADCAEELR